MWKTRNSFVGFGSQHRVETKQIQQKTKSVVKNVPSSKKSFSKKSFSESDFISTWFHIITVKMRKIRAQNISQTVILLNSKGHVFGI
jgi:hypothetical protein